MNSRGRGYNRKLSTELFPLPLIVCYSPLISPIAMAHLLEAVNQAFFTNTRLLADMAKHSNLDNVLHGAIRIVVLGAVIAALRKFASWASAKIERGESVTSEIKIPAE